MAEFKLQDLLTEAARKFEAEDFDVVEGELVESFLPESMKGYGVLLIGVSGQVDGEFRRVAVVSVATPTLKAVAKEAGWELECLCVDGDNGKA